MRDNELKLQLGEGLIFFFNANDFSKEKLKARGTRRMNTKMFE